MRVPGQRDLGDVVVHDVDPVDGLADAGRVADVSLDHVDAVAAGALHVDVEDAHGLTAAHQPVHQQPAEVPVAARHEARHRESPSSMHQRMLRRIPSSSATCGS